MASSASAIFWYENYMYSVVNVQCIGNPRTFTHELAHNQGAYHDPETALNGGMTQNEIDNAPYPNSFGYIAPGDAFRTIMAYGSSCGWCPSVEQFSNKNLTHLGLATGTERSNVHETLEATYTTIASFRSAASCTGQGDSDNDGVCDSLDNCLGESERRSTRRRFGRLRQRLRCGLRQQRQRGSLRFPHDHRADRRGLRRSPLRRHA